MGAFFLVVMECCGCAYGVRMFYKSSGCCFVERGSFLIGKEVYNDEDTRLLCGS